MEEARHFWYARLAPYLAQNLAPPRRLVTRAQGTLSPRSQVGVTGGGAAYLSLGPDGCLGQGVGEGPATVDQSGEPAMSPLPVTWKAAG